MIGKLLSGAAATVLAALDSPATGSDIVLGKEAYNSNGDKITGTLESINNPWKPSSQSEYDTIVESKNKVGNYIEYSGKTTKVMPEMLSGTFAVGDVVETVYFDTTKSPFLTTTSWDVENVNMGDSTYVRIKYLMVGDETVTISGTAVKKGLVYISDEANPNNYLIYDTTKSLPLYVGGTGWGIAQGWILDSTTFEAAITLTTVESNPLLTWNGTWAFKVRTPQYAKEYFPKPTLTNEGTASDLAKGKQLINSQGAIVTGTAAAASENKLAQVVDRSITEITEDDLTGLTSIGDYAFYNCHSLTSITIPNSVTSIGSQAFLGCSGLITIIVPRDVTSIGDGAFSGCYELTSITIPDNVTSIGWGAFSDCRSLTSITIPNSITSIDGSTFQDCVALMSITIGNSVNSIGWGAFKKCSGLTSITLLPTTPPTLDSGVFDGISTSAIFTVPKGTLETYKAADGWSTYADKMVEAAE